MALFTLWQASSYFRRAVCSAAVPRGMSRLHLASVSPRSTFSMRSDQSVTSRSSYWHIELLAIGNAIDGYR